MENKNKILIWLQLLVIIILGYLIIKSNQSIQQLDNLQELHSMQQNPNPTTYDLNIQKDDTGIWRVMDDVGNDMGDLEVYQGDTINWHFKDSNAEMGFKFMDEEEKLNRYFTFIGGGQFRDTPADVVRRFPGSNRDLSAIFRESRSQFVGNNNTITLKVKKNAPARTLYYPIYIAIDDTVVVGSSPAMLDIQESH